MAIALKDTATAIYKRQLEELNRRVEHYTKYRNYMRGDHQLVFASDRYDTAFGKMVKGLVDNRCPAIISAISDKLQLEKLECDDDMLQVDIDGWSHQHHFPQTVNNGTDKALTYGNAHVILSMLPNGDVKPHLQIPGSVIVWRNDETDEIEGAIKRWQSSDKIWRLTIWEDNRITRLTSKNDSDYAPTEWDAYTLDDIQYITMNRPPVFEFINEPDDYGHGQSLLRDVIPMQNALNKGWSDLLVSMEFAAFRQRWATGVDMVIDPVTGKATAPFEAGVERLWTFGNTDARVGSFEATDLNQYDLAINKFLSAMASCARVPMHAFAPSGNWPSGEAMRKAEEPLIARVKDRQKDWGDVVEAIVEYAMQWMGKVRGKASNITSYLTYKDAWMANAVNGKPRDNEGITIEAEWVEYDNRDALAEANEDKIQTETLLNKRELGISKQQALRELDYTEEDISTMDKENAAETNGMALLAGTPSPNTPTMPTMPMDTATQAAMTAKNNGTIGGE